MQQVFRGEIVSLRGTMTLAEIKRLITKGESETLELKKSTGQIKRAAETLCAFLNGKGGRVIVGVTPDRKITGQQVSDKTQQDIAAIFRRFEPPAAIETIYLSLPDSERKLIVFEAKFDQSVYPFSFDGRPYQRLGSTTSIMPQERYQQLLIARMHDRHRWENMTAVDENISGLDQEEILRTVRIGISTGRLYRNRPGQTLEMFLTVLASVLMAKF